ncbi:MAG: hypothetical protein CEO22_420 [Candidatus Berkelbacteria bacterium Gr01-1014_85]|uniref:Uncharacterized protein n=1 Tax=Candidatus Berkelbacteria bacterium Gr01-1014_85 TaxID=2017150 RepID=A0A554JB77_9BACT|nr:MAG: hypothetical protein CEO22_420 [Candidatus Berkelbacteria bacterium Gr01-1014_85]
MSQPRIYVGHIVTVVKKYVRSYALERHARQYWFASSAMRAERLWFSSDFIDDQFELLVDVVKGGPDNLTIGGNTSLGERMLIHFGCCTNYVLRGELASKQLAANLPVTRMAEYTVRNTHWDLLAGWECDMSTNNTQRMILKLNPTNEAVGCKPHEAVVLAVVPIEMRRSGEGQFILVAEVLKDLLQGLRKPGRVVVQVDTKAGINLAYRLPPR